MAKYDLVTDFDDDEEFYTKEEYDEEEYEDVSEFGDYSEKDAEQMWGNHNFEELIVELVSQLESSKSVMFSKSKRIVDGSKIAFLSQYIQNRLPGEIATSKDIISRENTIISDAENKSKHKMAIADEYDRKVRSEADTYYTTTKNEADSNALTTNTNAKKEAVKIIENAKKYADELVAKDEITRRAEDAATKLMIETREAAITLERETAAKCDKYKNNTIKNVESFMINAENLCYANLNKLQQSMVALNNEAIETGKQYHQDFDKFFSEIESFKNDY